MAKKPLKIIAGAPDRPLAIGDVEIQCYVLQDETRVLSQRGVFNSVSATRGGPRNVAGLGAQLPRFASQNWLKPFISKDLELALKTPILFQLISGPTAFGYPAPILVDLCGAIMEAERAGAITDRQAAIVERANILIRGCATVGIIALVDEATGYQEVRARKALATILENFIADQVQPWKKTFPYEFYKQIFKLKGWPGPDGVKRPSVIGHYTNDIVYKRVAPGVFDELKKLNPALPGGGRKWRNHQWFKPEPGYIKLNQHIAAVVALMKASANWDKFQSNLKRAFPKLRDQLDFDFDS